MNKIPQTLINYEMYLEGALMAGTVDVTLPNIQAKTQSIQGAGIFGVSDVPVLGHVQNMTMTVNFRVATEGIARLLPQQYQLIEFWPSLQSYDAGTGKLETVEQKVIVRAIPIGYNLGVLNPGEMQGTSLEFNVNYIKVVVGGTELLEVDVFNGKFVMNGNDMLSAVRQNIGI